MLNELHEVRRAFAGAGITVDERHPDVMSVGSKPALRVHLDEDGSVATVRVLATEEAERLWTLRRGKHNSFPYHQTKASLLFVPSDDERRVALKEKGTSDDERWTALRALLDEGEFNEQGFAKWPGRGYLKAVRERRDQLAALRDTKAAAVPEVCDRFLRAAERPHDLLRGIVEAIHDEVHRGPASSDLPLLMSLLVEEGGAIFFDVARGEVTRSSGRFVADDRNVIDVSRALAEVTGNGKQGQRDTCALAGVETVLLRDNFPQPNLPLLGETYLFARNDEAPTNSRYGRSGTDSVSVGLDTAMFLHGAITRLTLSEWEGKTWKKVAGERPKQIDLFVAFVPADPKVPLAELLTRDAEPEEEEEFTTFAHRLVEALRGKEKDRREGVEVEILVLRKLDPANRKAVYSARLNADSLVAAAERWSEGCGNVPPPIRVPVPVARGRPARRLPPWDVAPFSLPHLTRQHFIRGGTQRQEIVGLTYDDAMRLFLAPEGSAAQFARSVLRRVLRSRAVLLEGVGHAQSREPGAILEFDRREALKTITLLGLLLHKRGRSREEYMKDAAYQLGQLLAGADALHAAYNASERGGASLPPRLIGNAALPMAQANPQRALAVLGRRWMVYDGWARRKGNGWSFPERFLNKRRKDVAKKDLAEFDRAQVIRRGLSAVRRLQVLAPQLRSALATAEVDDEFRAELLLGYIAGPPRITDGGSGGDSTPDDSTDTNQPGDE